MRKPRPHKPLSAGEEILRALILSERITEADLASFRNRLLGSRMTPKKEASNAQNAKKAGRPTKKEAARKARKAALTQGLFSS